jgi:hypothetical protein
MENPEPRVRHEIPQHFLWAGALLFAAAAILAFLALQGSDPGTRDHSSFAEDSLGSVSSLDDDAYPCPVPMSKIKTITGRIRKGEVKEHKLLIDWPLAVSIGVMAQNGDLDLSLISPSGVTYDRSSARADSRVRYSFKSTSFLGLIDAPTRALTICDPEEGEWTIRVTAIDAPRFVFSATYMLIIPERPKGTIFMTVGSGKAVVLGRALGLDVLLAVDGRPVTDAEVRANIRYPDRRSVDISMSDDGEAGDVTAGDGIYHGGLNRTDLPGSYNASFTATRAGVAGKPDISARAHGGIGVCRSTSRMTGEFREHTNDLDGDGRWDELVIEVGVDVTVPLEYSVGAGIVDAKNHGKRVGGQSFLQPGIQYIPIVITAEGYHDDERAKTPVKVGWVILSEKEGQSPITIDHRDVDYHTQGYE